MAKAVVEFFDVRRTDTTRPILNQPFPESVVEGSVFAPGDLARTVDRSFVGAKSDVLHTLK
jgi:hypothetical protein